MDAQLEFFGGIEILFALQDQKLSTRNIIARKGNANSLDCETRFFKRVHSVKRVLLGVHLGVKCLADLFFCLLHSNVRVEVELLVAVCNLKLTHVDIDLSHCARPAKLELNACAALFEDLVVAKLVFHFFFIEKASLLQVFQTLLARKIKLHDQKVAQLCQCPIQIDLVALEFIFKALNVRNHSS